MGNCGRGSNSLETDCQKRPPQLRRGISWAVSSEEAEEESPTPGGQTSDKLHLCTVRKTATPVSACLVAPDAVSGLLPNVQHYSLQMKNDPRSYDRNFYNCVKKPEKNSGLQRGLNPWPRDTGATLYQLSYEATDVGSRSILGSYVPVKDMYVWYLIYFICILHYSLPRLTVPTTSKATINK